VTKTVTQSHKNTVTVTNLDKFVTKTVMMDSIRYIKRVYLLKKKKRRKNENYFYYFENN